MKKKRWYDYLWIMTIVYFALGFFNILFAWLGMIDFFSVAEASSSTSWAVTSNALAIVWLLVGCCPSGSAMAFLPFS